MRGTMTTTPRHDDDKLTDETRVLVSVAKRQWERTFDAISEPLMIIDERYVIKRANLALADELGMAIQRVAAIGRLAGGVAHEINNPLGGILAFAQIMRREKVTDAERDEYLAEIEKSALRCKAIVESLLRFARQASRTERRSLLVNDVV